MLNKQLHILLLCFAVATSVACQRETHTLPVEPEFCGNAMLGLNEACDDGNEASGDGCSSECALESGWTCEGDPSVCTANDVDTPDTPTDDTPDTPADDADEPSAEEAQAESLCDMVGSGDGLLCVVELASCHQSATPTTALQFDLDFDRTKVSLTGVSCPAIVDGAELDLCTMVGRMPSGHTVQIKDNHDGQGSTRIFIYNTSGIAPINHAYMAGDAVVGESSLLDLVFATVGTDSAAGATEVQIKNIVAINAASDELDSSVSDQRIITSTP